MKVQTQRITYHLNRGWRSSGRFSSRSWSQRIPSGTDRSSRLQGCRHSGRHWSKAHLHRYWHSTHSCCHRNQVGRCTYSRCRCPTSERMLTVVTYRLVSMNILCFYLHTASLSLSLSWLILTVQLPPLRQGFPEHSLTWISQLAPVYPGRQEQV